MYFFQERMNWFADSVHMCVTGGVSECNVYDAKIVVWSEMYLRSACAILVAMCNMIAVTRAMYIYVCSLYDGKYFSLLCLELQRAWLQWL